MAIQVRNGDVVLFAGDSVTAGGYPTVAGGIVDKVNAQLYASYAATAGTGNRGAIAGPGNIPALSVRTGIARAPITAVNVGVAGTTSTDMLSTLPGQLVTYQPNVVVILIGTNEHWGVGGWTQALSQSNLEALCTMIRNNNSATKIMLLSLLTFSEQWAAGPVWSPLDPETDQHGVMIQTVAGEFGAEFVDLRTPMLVQESLLNTPAPGAVSGVLTIDGRHPNTAGQLFMGNVIIPHFLVVP